MKLPSSTEVYLAMIPRRSSLLSCFGSGSEAMSSSMIAVDLSSSNETECGTRVSSDSTWSRKIVVVVGGNWFMDGMVETHCCGNSEERHPFENEFGRNR